MRAVSRGAEPAPAGLRKRDKDNKTELERARAHMIAPLAAGKKRDAFPFESYKSEDVRQRLEKLFHGKCAYCESFYGSQAPVDIEHYRPKGRVEGSGGHPGYWWLAAEWTNLLPSCIDCNRRRKQYSPVISSKLEILYNKLQTGKGDSFPIQGVHILPEGNDFTSEKALLLDPTRDNPSEHLYFWLGNDKAAGIVYPAPNSKMAGTFPAVPAASDDLKAVENHAVKENVSLKGAISIQCFGLNRLRLVQERARLVQQLRFLESILTEIGEVKDELESLNPSPSEPKIVNAVKKLLILQNRVLDQMRGLAAPESPYSTVAVAYLKDLRMRLSNIP
jgi:hypothetical protein